MDFDSRYTLLELFAETTSSEEHCMSFEGIHLPQIPGKQLFALVKRYLRVTSLLEELGSGEEQGGEQPESSRVKQEFEFSMAMAGLIVELLRAMGWEHSHEPEPPAWQEAKPHNARSIFQPQTPACFAAPAPVLSPNRSAQKKQGAAFLTLSDFADRSSYVEYVQANLVPGMRVRLLEDCGEVRAGDEGEFLHSTDRMHTAQVLWQSTGRTYWMHWHMLEIIGFGDQWDDAAGQEKEYSLIESFNLEKVGEDKREKSRLQVPLLCSASDVNLEGNLMKTSFEQASGLDLTSARNEICMRSEANYPLSKCSHSQLKRRLVYRLLALDVVVALERQLCGGGPDPEPSGRAAPRPQERRCFRALLRSLELRGAEKSVGLRILRILDTFLDGFQEDALPWHECVEPCLSWLSAHGSDREAAQAVVGFLQRLAAASKDCAVAMCRAGTYEALDKALEQHGSAVPTAPALLQLLSGCEKFAGLHRTLTGSILAGCMQLALGQIEEHRRSQRPISIPFLDVFLRKLCRGERGERGPAPAVPGGQLEAPRALPAGSSAEAKEDKCWEKVQVSSNPHRAGRLTDGNPKTYWESNGSTGSHFITLHMQSGVVVRELSMLVASEDSSYMPARVVVLGGDSPAAIRTELNAVTVPPSASRVVLLRNAPRSWPLIQIRVKRCQQGGIDTRVRGIEVLGPKPSFWPVFKEQLCRRTSLCCAARAHAWGQEIRRDRGRLLQLFGRLSQALRHEQDFAERFLPDDEAARALGRTCWEALVSPLLQSITSPDPGGVSPLAWLLGEYLGSGEPAQRPPARGDAFGSRVRLLTQLLVHVDPGGAEPEEARAAGALRLNRAALAQASGRQLRLLPWQRYLRAERAESGALERKRNVLCCLLSRILKAEKRLHIDNLVFRVLAACQKGELGPGLQFPSFCCHSVDVLSCVLHLLNQGYLRRQEERPHVLEYVPDESPAPPSSQAQPPVAFQTVEIKTAPSPAAAERRQTFSTFR
ncbi:Cullin-9 isoform X3 [Aix galericulata]|nr:Cullin-9 isoform X3 [Aix galericulata]